MMETNRHDISIRPFEEAQDAHGGSEPNASPSAMQECLHEGLQEGQADESFGDGAHRSQEGDAVHSEEGDAVHREGKGFTALPSAPHPCEPLGLAAPPKALSTLGASQPASHRKQPQFGYSGEVSAAKRQRCDWLVSTGGFARSSGLPPPGLQ